MNKKNESVLSSISEELFEIMKSRIEKLMELMVAQGYSNSHSIIVDLKAAKDENMLSKDNIEWDETASKLRKCIEEVRPFNIAEMLALYKKTDEAAKQVAGAL